MQELITTLFSSQSTKSKKTIQEEETDDENVMVSFAELQFNHDNEDIHDDLIILGKKFKILNSKINSILQFLADNGSKHLVSGVGVDIFWKLKSLD